MINDGVVFADALGNIPRISNKINSMTNEDLIKTWRSAKRKPHRFIEKVKELIK